MAGLFLIWGCVPLISVGTYLQTQSPQFAAYREKVVREVLGPAEHLNRAGHLAFEFTFSWQFGVCFSAFFACLFTAGGAIIRVITRRYRDCGLLLAGAFGLGCLVGAGLGLGEMFRSFLWGFVTLGQGYGWSAVALGVGGLGVRYHPCE
jgi:hypothetical protein